MTHESSAASDPAPSSGASAAKHRAILAAAEDAFLAQGYLGTNMDGIANVAGVSKQTVYKHFGSKEALFLELVSTMAGAAGDEVHTVQGAPLPDGDVTDYLEAYAERQLEIVMTPRLLRLRRLVIGEAARFPDLARALYESGPGRAIAAFQSVIQALVDRGLLEAEDPAAAATAFNWLVMGRPMNEAMLLGDDAIPSAAARRHHARECVRVFLAAYGT